MTSRARSPSSTTAATRRTQTDDGDRPGLRVVAPDESPGLVDTIVGEVTGFFIGG